MILSNDQLLERIGHNLGIFKKKIEVLLSL